LAHPQFANLLYDQGFYSSSRIVEWMNEYLNKLLPLAPHPVTFRSLPILTYIVSTDLIRSEAKVWSRTGTPNELVANAVFDREHFTGERFTQTETPTPLPP
jgi:hypothetical protein